MRGVALFVLAAACFVLPTQNTYASFSMSADYLCETGKSFLKQQRYEEALDEFEKALILDPDSAVARKYITVIEKIIAEEEEPGASVLQPQAAPVLQPEKRAAVIDKAIGQYLTGQKSRQPVTGSRANPSLQEDVDLPSEPLLGTTVKLQDIQQISSGPLQIEVGKSISLESREIQRFLVTETRVLEVIRKDADTLTVLAKDIGYTYLHVWDTEGRHTYEFLVVPRRPQGLSLEEQARLAEERFENFQFRYSMDWSMFETGRRLTSLNRTDYSFVHNLSFWGPTPYGNLDAAVAASVFPRKTELTHYTIGFTDATIGQFKGFSVRGFDIFDLPPAFSNLSYSGTPLRGGYITSPAFNNKLHYTAFYGRENTIPLGVLSPTVTKTRNAFVNGLNVNLTPTKKQEYNLNFLHGWGKDREANLNAYGYDASGTWTVGRWQMKQEAAFDSNVFAYLTDARYADEKLNFNAELRDVNKKFTSITGDGWRQGERGAAFSASYRPNDKLETYASLDVYQDRLFPAQDNPDRLNEDFNWSAAYRFDNKTQGRINYALQNELGRLSQYRYQNADVGISRTVHFLRDIEFSTNYFHQEYSNYSNPVSDYMNDRIFAGMRFSIIGRLYCYANKEFNWLEEVYNKRRSTPNVFETGLDWSDRLGRSPFYGIMRFSWRDEENTASDLSFLSGEDYIEGYSELNYRPSPDVELYGSVRIRNVWADNPRVAKRYEAYFNAGLRYLWNTGVSWQSTGDVEGYVFKDINSDGIMDRNEAPVEGVEVWIGKNRSAVTDIFGYYLFKSVNGKRAQVSLATDSIPDGYVLTVPSIQQVSVRNHQVSRLDFGIASRSEISGFVFDDRNGDGMLNPGDVGIKGVTIVLNENKKTATDASGRYSFASVNPGEHLLQIDLDTLPVYFVPTVPLTKKILLFEGATYYYHIPLKRNPE